MALSTVANRAGNAGVTLYRDTDKREEEESNCQQDIQVVL